MRDLVTFNIAQNGNISIKHANGPGQTIIFSENFLLNRAAIELPGVITWPSQPTLPLIDEVITINPDTGPTLTFQVVDISPYEDSQGDVPDPSILVYYSERVT